MQRLFSTFPAGLPGSGLLLLRTALAVAIFAQVGALLNAQVNPSFRILFAAIAAIVGGSFLLFGFLTPVIAGLLFAGGFAAALFYFTSFAQAFFSPVNYIIVLSAAVILLGPGAFSLDARLFGRREIIIPRN